jgi:magnesium transporter
MIRARFFSQQEGAQSISLDEILPYLSSSDGLLWVDFVEEPERLCRPILEEVFKFHQLAVDDALQETHVPKVDDWGAYLYIVFRAVKYEDQFERALQTPELDVFFGSNFLVTYQGALIPSVETIWQLSRQDHRYLDRGTGYLLYNIVDDIITNAMGVIEEIDDFIDQIEDQVLLDPQPSTLEDIFKAKRAVLELRRTLLPQREVFNKLSRGDFALIKPDDHAYFRDAYDHLVRLQEINENMRDLVGGAMEIYLSVVNNRMNDVMKTLTVITTLFMPLSFLTGFFGMNFFQVVIPLDIWTGKWMFAAVLFGMIFVPIGMYIWMKRRAWM